MWNRIRCAMAVGCVWQLLAGGVAHGQSNAERMVEESAKRPVCRAVDGQLPPSVDVDRGLLPLVRSMLLRSEDFRRQCERLAEQPWVFVRVRLSVAALPQEYCARSVIQRTLDGPIMAQVEIGRSVDWPQWIAHELEHVLEQAEGVDITRQPGSWRSGDATYETSRAIFAGRRVRREMSGKRPAPLATND